MALISKPTGLSSEGQISHEILKKVDRLGQIASFPSSGLTDTQLRATPLDVIVDSNTDGSQKTQITDTLGNTLLPSGTPVKVSCEFTRPADILDYAAYDSIANSITVTDELVFDGNVAIANGGGGVITLAKIEAPAKWAGLVLQIWLYNSTPSTLYADNVAFVLDTANSLKRIGYIEVTMDAVINGSSVVFGQAVCYVPYVCASTAKTIKAFLVTKSAVVAPTTAAKFSISLTVTIQS